MWFPMQPLAKGQRGRVGFWLLVLCVCLSAGSGRPEDRPSSAQPQFEASGLPRIGRSDTVIHFQANRLGPVPSPFQMKIFNEEDVGVLQWDIFEDRSWLSTSPGSATGNETDVAVWIVNTDAQLGHHTAHLVIQSDNAVNSPETVWVEVDMLCPVPITGDANHDGRLSQGDVIYLVNNVLRGGPPPVPVWQAGDTNCDEALTQSDIIVIVNYLLRAGPSPCNVCQFF